MLTWLCSCVHYALDVPDEQHKEHLHRLALRAMLTHPNHVHAMHAMLPPLNFG